MFEYLFMFLCAPFYPKFTFDKLKQRELSELNSLKYILINLILGFGIPILFTLYNYDIYYSFYVFKHLITDSVFVLMLLFVFSLFVRICLVSFQNDKYFSPKALLISSFSILIYLPILASNYYPEYDLIFFIISCTWAFYIIKSGFKRLFNLDTFTSVILMFSGMFVSYNITTWLNQLLAFAY